MRVYKKVNDKMELCFYVEALGTVTEKEREILVFLLSETFEQDLTKGSPFLTEGTIIEVGPLKNFATPFSTNAVAICHACGLKKITRIEVSRRYLVSEGVDVGEFIAAHHDRMTECVYQAPLESFKTGIIPEPVYKVLIIKEGKKALSEINKRMGLALDEQDIEFYYNLFVEIFGRNPTNVECFGLGQANSEHSRHKFFNGKLVIGGQEMPQTLMEIIKRTLVLHPEGDMSGFGGNASAIRGFAAPFFVPFNPGKSSPLRLVKTTLHLTAKGETHNFPTGVAPFPGAQTGTGGEIRDRMGPGFPIFGTAGYCAGNLNIPNFSVTGEIHRLPYPNDLASPLRILIEASNGASDYGNKFGQPLIGGFTRTFGLVLFDGSRREWLKPIMFAGGMGMVDERHLQSKKPEKGMLIVMIGGPAYRIGLGGGAASSMNQGENRAELDFNAVQRGDPEMEQKVYRALRACFEMGDDNPIISVHDQGAGGVFNVLMELVGTAGGTIEIRTVNLGDETLSILEIVGAEYQERMAILILPERLSEFQAICGREKVNCEILGEITGDGIFSMRDANSDTYPVNLDMRKILANTPQKVFNTGRIPKKVSPIVLPNGITVEEVLQKIFLLPSVGSKGFLVNKVDRSVGGLIVQQQCCGHLQLPVSDHMLAAQSYFGKTGMAMALGEQPIKMLVDSKAGARMAVAEALTNMMGVLVKDPRELKCVLNWMWPAKSPGEAAELYDAAVAACNLITLLSLAVNGGKDSLTMAKIMPDGKLVKSPGNMVVSLYGAVPDIEKHVTPDIKWPGESKLIFIDFSTANTRLGGSALAQAFSQIGNEAPDVDVPQMLLNGFLAMQQLLGEDLILSCHDRSDGGLITTLAEMAMAGNCGMNIFLPENAKAIPYLFCEEAGVVLECKPDCLGKVISIFQGREIYPVTLGDTTVEKRVKISQGGKIIFNVSTATLRKWWEATSDRLEELQANPECVREAKKCYERKGHSYELTFIPEPTPADVVRKYQVAIIREEGSQCDRETAAAFYMAGFSPVDVTMTDLMEGDVVLERFRGVVFAGGFSYADALGSAKGWAAAILFNEKLRSMFDEFYARPDTFSLGICNGCQLMALLGWVPWRGIELEKQSRFIANTSGRFESRWETVMIMESPSIMLEGMAGSTLGIWVAHGEGRLYLPKAGMYTQIISQKLAPIAFVDDEGCPTEKYPFNPNGSPCGITALCAPDGRHLAMMPHPERAFLKWQWPWMPEDWNKNLAASPWLKMFQNAREWCEKHR